MSSDDKKLVSVEKKGFVTTVTITRLAQRNAVDGATAQELHDAFKAFDADETARVAVLCGTGGTFCAGADLKGFSNPLHEDMAQMGPMGISRLRLSKPVIAAVQGFAVAGGLELSLWCDLRVVEEGATFGVFCRRWGVPLIDGGTVRLARLIGQSRAMDLVLTGRPVTANEALAFGIPFHLFLCSCSSDALGLANRVVPNGTAIEAAQALANEIAQFPQLCMRNDRLSMLDSHGLNEKEALRTEFKYGLQVLMSGESQAGAAKFASGAGRHGSKL